MTTNGVPLIPLVTARHRLAAIAALYRPCWQPWVLVYRLDRRSIRPFVFRVAQISRLAFRFAQGAVKRAEAGARLGMEGNGEVRGNQYKVNKDSPLNNQSLTTIRLFNENRPSACSFCISVSHKPPGFILARYWHNHRIVNGQANETCIHAAGQNVYHDLAVMVLER